MKTRENQRACDDYFHREACHMWSSGAISNTVASKCQQFEPVSYETLKELQDLYKMHKGEVAPVVHGEWVEKNEPYAYTATGREIHIFHCSVCDFTWANKRMVFDHFKHCPNCGAKMDGGEDNA